MKTKKTFIYSICSLLVLLFLFGFFGKALAVPPPAAHLWLFETTPITPPIIPPSTQGTAPRVTTGVNTISGLSATLAGSISNHGTVDGVATAGIREKGIYYWLQGSPVVTLIDTSNGDNISQTTGNLSLGNYNYQAYAINSTGRKGTGAIKTFAISAVPPKPTAPVVQTLPATNITSTSAVMNGQVISTGSSELAPLDKSYTRGYGFIIDVNSTSCPVGDFGYAESDVSAINGNTGKYSKTITGLTPATTYYFVAFALNNNSRSNNFVDSRGLGECLSFTTLSNNPPLPTYKLTTAVVDLTSSGDIAGTVSADSPGTSCGAGCATYSSGTKVTLTEKTNSSDSTFTSWGGVCSGADTTCTVTMDSDKNVIADFIVKRNLEVSKLQTKTVNGAKTSPITTGIGTVKMSSAGFPDDSCNSGCLSVGYQFSAGSSVTITETPDSGTTFTGWSGGSCSGTDLTCTVTMNRDLNVTATFDEASTTTYTIIALAGPGGTISPSGTVPVASGATPAFTFTPDSGYHVAGYQIDSNPVVATINTRYTFSAVTADHTIKVTFSNSTLPPTPPTGGLVSPRDIQVIVTWIEFGQTRKSVSDVLLSH